MNDYFDAKEKLFRDLLSASTKPHPTAVINGDDEFGRRIRTQARLWRYGRGSDCELQFKIGKSGFDGTTFQLRTPFGSQEFHLRMVGAHMVMNACGAIGAALAAGIPLSVCAEALASFKGVSGRLEAVENSRGLHVFVDYAHTDDALHTVLHYLGEIRKESGGQNRIITVFGCGGDRDRGKRPLMMKAALHGSDLVVLTSDNPRTENPERILDDAASAATQEELALRVFREVDRRRGISKAIELAHPGDVILIAGKGHEDYQQIGTVKIPFSDVSVAKELLL